MKNKNLILGLISLFLTFLFVGIIINSFSSISEESIQPLDSTSSVDISDSSVDSTSDIVPDVDPSIPDLQNLNVLFNNKSVTSYETLFFNYSRKYKFTVENTSSFDVRIFINSDSNNIFSFKVDGVLKDIKNYEEVSGAFNVTFDKTSFTIELPESMKMFLKYISNGEVIEIISKLSSVPMFKMTVSNSTSSIDVYFGFSDFKINIDNTSIVF